MWGLVGDGILLIEIEVVLKFHDHGNWFAVLRRGRESYFPGRLNCFFG